MHNNATKTWKKDIKNHKNACMNKEREEKNWSLIKVWDYSFFWNGQSGII